MMVMLGASAQTTTVPTWSSDVACIIYSHCSSCHNPTSIAPFSLLTYNDALSERVNIKYYVSNKLMPPYLPSTSYQHYTDMRTLTDQEINTLVAWADAGGPLGDTTHVLPQPVFTTSVQLTHPDLTARIPYYTVPNTGNDLYRDFVLTPNGFDTTRFIKSIEVIPGNRNAVHHVLVYEDTAYSVVAADSADPQPGYTNFGGTGSRTSNLLYVWVPGEKADSMPSNMGMKFTKGSRIIIQIHYPVTAQGMSDSTRVNIQFTSSNAVRNVSVTPVLNYVTNMTDGPLRIPADSVKTFHEKYRVPVDVSLLSISPHAHLVCTQMKSFAVTPAGDTIPLIDIPRWDFHWQGAHSFQRPIKIPAGSYLYGEGVYDNTYNNPDVPQPLATVTAGEATSNEMLIFFMWYTPYISGDENIIVDTASHDPHYMGCVTSWVADTTSSTGISHVSAAGDLNIYPNPAQSILHYHSSTELTEITIIDIAGKVVEQLSVSGTDGQIPLGNMVDGLYFVRIQDKSGTVQILRFTKD